MKTQILKFVDSPKTQISGYLEKETLETNGLKAIWQKIVF